MFGDVTEVDEGLLRRLGIHRIPVPVPFLEAGGPVNVYAIADEGGGWALYDSGIGTPDGVAALYAGASTAGVDLRRVTRVIVSHGHVDHFGNAQALAEASDAPIYAHRHDWPKVLGNQRLSQVLAGHRDYFLTALGVPGDAFEAMVARAGGGGPVSRPVEPARLHALAEGDVFRFLHFEAVAQHHPGHTPGLMCLHAPTPGLFFASDHVLAKVSPNPLLDLSLGEGVTKHLALVCYLESARRVRDTALTAVLPGHGASFSGHRQLLDGLFDFYERRQGKLLARLREGPLTVYEAVEVLFGRRHLPHLPLTLSEALGNLEVLEVRGLVARSEGSDGLTRYAPA